MKPLLGNLFVVDKILFGQLRPENCWKLKLLKFLQVLLTVTMILFDIIFHFAVYFFIQHCEQCKGFFDQKIKKWQFEGNY